VCAANPGVSCEGSLGDDLWVFSYSVFGDDYRLNMDCVRRQNRASAGEAVSLMILEPWAINFSVAISESSGTLCVNESTRQLWKQCRWWFLSWQLLSFRGWFPIKRECVRDWIQASLMEAVSLIISVSSATKFSLAISQFTGYLCADESRCQLMR
jgi:hypothetical protein